MLRFLKIFISLKTTVACLAWLAVLIVVGTLYQNDYGLDAAQKKFFFSWFLAPCFPGGMTTMALLTVNLMASLVVHFRFGWRMAGLITVHCGLLLMMVGGVFIYYSSKESVLALREGEATNLSEHHKIWELAVSTSDNSEDMRTVHAFDTNRLKPGHEIRFEELGLTVTVTNYYEDAKVKFKGANDYARGDRLATAGQHLQGVDLRKWLASPGRFARMRQSGRGEALLADLALDIGELDADATELRDQLLAECDVVVAEDSSEVEAFLDAHPELAEKTNVLTDEERPDDVRFLVGGIQERQMLVVLLRSGRPQPVMDEMLRQVGEAGEIPFIQVVPELTEPPYDIAGFDMKPTRREVEKELLPLKEKELRATLKENNWTRPSRLTLTMQNILGKRDTRFHKVEKIEKTWEKRIQADALNKTPEARVPGLVAEVRFDDDEDKVHPLVLDGAYGAYSQTALDPKIVSNGGATTNWFRLQKKHYELPLLVQLNDFIRTEHANKAMDKEYIARITVRGLGQNEGFEQDASVEMNKPYRHKGWTFYQSSFNQAMPDFTQLTTRFTSGRLLPYISTIVVFLGLAIHFLLVLSDSSKRLARELDSAK